MKWASHRGVLQFHIEKNASAHFLSNVTVDVVRLWKENKEIWSELREVEHMKEIGNLQPPTAEPSKKKKKRERLHITLIGRGRQWGHKKHSQRRHQSRAVVRPRSWAKSWKTCEFVEDRVWDSAYSFITDCRRSGWKWSTYYGPGRGVRKWQQPRGLTWRNELDKCCKYSSGSP